MLFGSIIRAPEKKVQGSAIDIKEMTSFAPKKALPVAKEMRIPFERKYSTDLFEASERVPDELINVPSKSKKASL